MKAFISKKIRLCLVGLMAASGLLVALVFEPPLFWLWQLVLLLLATVLGASLALLAKFSLSQTGLPPDRHTHDYATLDIAINSQPDALLAIDPAGRILLVNQAARKLFFMEEEAAQLLTPEWPAAQGLFVPGTDMVFPFEEMPLFRGLRGDSGGPTRIFLRNSRHPQGRMLSYSYMPLRGSDQIQGALCIFSDITELDRLQTEQARDYLALCETQRRLLDAQQLGRIGIWEMNLQRKTLWLSPEMRDLYGLSSDHFESSTDQLLAMIHPEDRSAYQLLHQAASNAGKPLNTEYRIVMANGQVRWMNQFDRVQPDSRGKPLFRIGVVQEITSRKQADIEIARTTEMLNRTGELAKVGGWEIDVKTWVPVVSEAIYRIHEVERSTVFTPRKAVGFYAPEARPAMRAALLAALKEGQGWDMEMPLRTATGRPIWVRTQGTVLFKEGKVYRLVGVLQDITAQRQAQDHLRLLETCIARLNDVVVITEAWPFAQPGPRIVFVNDAFERMTGYSRDEALQSTPRLTQGPKTQRLELDRIKAALQDWQPIHAELINYKKSGDTFWVELNVVPISNDKGFFTHWVSIQRDITERKQAEQALLESQQRYAALFDTAPVPMWVHDSSDRFLQVNQATIQSYGYSAEEFKEMSIFDIWPDAVQTSQLLPTHFKTAIEFRFARQHRRKDGSFFPVNVEMRAIQDVGKPACFVVALDMSAQVQAEKEVQSYLFTLQRAADATRAITWHQTLEGTMQEVAEQARLVIGAHHAMLSLTTGEHGVQSTQALSISDKYPGYREVAGPMDGTSTFAMVCQYHRSLRMSQAQISAHSSGQSFGDYADQHPAMQGWLAVALTGRDGKNIGLLQLSDKYQGEFTQQDEYVTVELAQLASVALEKSRLIQEVSQLNTSLEKKVAERTAALAQQEAKFRVLAEQAPEIVWTASPLGEVTYVNKAWFDLAGGTWDGWLQAGWYKAIHPEDLPDMQAGWKRAMADPTQYNGIRRIRSKDGSWHTTSYRSAPVFDVDGLVSFWVGIDTDITEFKTIEAALRLSNQELEAFSYSVSHDLRAPLNTIDGFSRLLKKQVTSSQPNEERILHYISRIHAGVAQMGKLIEDLLSLAQVSRVQLNHQPIDLTRIAKNIFEELQSRAPERTVVVCVTPGLQAYGDSRLVGVALENLLGNAWKFTSENPEAVVTVGQTEDSGGLPVFFVKDNGAGFDMAYVDKLFTPFQRLHAAGEFPGTGIGLATVSRIINRHGGKLWAKAAPGVGATFYFTLPQSSVVL